MKLQTEKSILSSVNIHNVLYLLVALLLFVILFEINSLTPYIGEDYGLSIPHHMKSYSNIEKMQLVINKIHDHFFTWNSRIGEQVAIVFLAVDKSYFDFFNAILAVGLFHLIGKMSQVFEISREDTPWKTILLLIAFSLTILGCPSLGSMFFWLTGAANYLWGMMILFSFFLPYWQLLANGPQEKGLLFLIAISLGGILAGLTNENSVPVILIAVTMILWYSKKRGGNLYRPLWPLAGLISLGIGYGLLIFSPSTAYRVAFYQQVLGSGSGGMQLYWQRLLTIGNTLFDTCGMIMILIIIAMGIHYFSLKKKQGSFSNDKGLLMTIAFYLGSHISVLLLIFSPYVDEKAFFLVFISSLLLLITLVKKIGEEKAMEKKIAIMTLLITLLASWQLHSIFTIYSDYRYETAAREKTILTGINRGLTDLVVHEYKRGDTRILDTREVWLSQNKRYKRYADYYGVDNIKFEKYVAKQFFPLQHIVAEDIAFSIGEIQKQQDYFYFNGWAFYPNSRSADYDIYVILKHQNGYYYAFDTKKQVRKDVAEHFSNQEYTNSGFETLLDFHDIPSGQYEVGIGLIKHNKKSPMLLKMSQQKNGNHFIVKK